MRDLPMPLEGRRVLTLHRHTGRLGRWTATGAAAALLFVAVTNAWVQARERGNTFAALDAVPARAIAIVPGSPTSRREVKASLEGRVKGALALYRSGRARAILVSGVDTAADPETSAMRRWLEDRGVPARDIVDDPLGTRTRETMHRAADSFGVERAIVCTEAIAMPRALFLARASGIDAVGLEVPSALDRRPKWIAVEALKTTLAFVEEAFGRPTPATAGRLALR